MSKHIEAVEIEKRATEIAAGACRSWREKSGILEHPESYPLNPSTSYWSGWLSSEIATPDERATRDADAWPWDPSRPVDWQYEEWIAAGRPKCAACSTSDGCDLHEVFTCAACGRLTTWTDGTEDDTCTMCYIAREREAEQRRHHVAAAVARHADLPTQDGGSWDENRRAIIDDTAADLKARGVTDTATAVAEIRTALDERLGEGKVSSLPDDHGDDGRRVGAYYCRNCGDLFTADAENAAIGKPSGAWRPCPNPSPGRPLVDCGVGGHMYHKWTS
jgi:hypothetical protein